MPGASVASSELNKLDHYGDRLALYTEIIKMALYINTINKIALKNHHHIEEKSIPIRFIQQLFKAPMRTVIFTFTLATLKWLEK